MAALGLGLAMVGGLSLVAAAPATAAPAYSLSGTVNLDDGAGNVVPADGAIVTDVDNPANSTSTDSDGAFTLAGLSDGTYSLEITKDGYATSTTEATIAGADGTLPAVVTLNADAPQDPEPTYYSITGTVTAKDGNPDFAATVEMNENNGYSNTVIPVDSDGTFSFENLEPNPDVTLTFSADGYDTVVKDVAITDGNATVSVELAPTPPALQGGTVKITGEAVVGNVLTATTSGWPAGTTLSYQWGFSGGEYGGPIDGATANTYKVTADKVGMKLVVLVTGSKDGFTPTTESFFMPTAVTAAKPSTPASTKPTSAPKPQPAAAAPASDSGGLAVYLDGRGVTAQSQTSVGLPAGSLDPAEDYTATLDWTAADSYVDVYLYSTPTFVGTFPVVDGTAKITLSEAVLSELEAGNHTLVVTGQSSGSVQAVALTVADVLASTGFNAGGPLTVAVLLVLLGGALLVVRRRRLRA
jgi:hypothetical protein